MAQRLLLSAKALSLSYSQAVLTADESATGVFRAVRSAEIGVLAPAPTYSSVAHKLCQLLVLSLPFTGQVQ